MRAPLNLVGLEKDSKRLCCCVVLLCDSVRPCFSVMYHVCVHLLRWNSLSILSTRFSPSSVYQLREFEVLQVSPFL
ncbi:hypothetical protein K2173_009756 [Erythroxylum novogranatense]|uniref:Uncharacterized protein n=1 Tax=Erythroxylum novogranatense TaxID=1862640 RepID=A0AAV8T050_9ROSI|nr:hypothetical protein K2173_009756 [Erythroxylum novogranatense]